MYCLGNMEIRQIYVGKSANIYFSKLNDFLLNSFILSPVAMKTAAIAKNTCRGHLTIKVKKTDPP